MKNAIRLAGLLVAFSGGVFAKKEVIRVSIKNETSNSIVAILVLNAEAQYRITCPAVNSVRMYTGGAGSSLNSVDKLKVLQSLVNQMAFLHERISSIAFVPPKDSSTNLMVDNCNQKGSNKKVFDPSGSSEVNFSGDPGKLRDFSLLVGIPIIPFNKEDPHSKPGQFTWYQKGLSSSDNQTNIHFYHPEEQKAQFRGQQRQFGQDRFEKLRFH